ncbi:MAG: hypothetical protein HY601_02365 [Candidatus Omnitrophica bacterium]|nr:hypothetical protein [Candidatus Omnitrophota bacterium]
MGIALAAALLGVPGFCAAAEPAAKRAAVCPICSKTLSDQTDYGTKAGHTLLRGATNTFFGWTEMILQPAQTAKEGGNVFTGLAKGLGQGLTRTLNGAAEVATFWTPKINQRYLTFSEDCPICMGRKTP